MKTQLEALLPEARAAFPDANIIRIVVAGKIIGGIGIAAGGGTVESWHAPLMHSADAVYRERGGELENVGANVVRWQGRLYAVHDGAQRELMVEQNRHYDRDGYCDNPARGY